MGSLLVTVSRNHTKTPLRFLLEAVFCVRLTVHLIVVFLYALVKGRYGVPNIKRVQEYAKNRITLIGYGELVQDTAALYELPLPFNFSKQKMYRCLTVTLASFTPIRPATQKYRSSQIWFNLEPGDKNHGLKRLDADDKAVARGTLQHERFGGNSAVVWGEDDILGIKINCRADAHDFTEQIPYALFATFEIAPEHNIDVYEKIAEKVRQKVKEAVKPK